ncbi:hypothetical protein DEO72_LG8g2614 [Vigna unguiculata]|uniref:Uncharacterized protein n=1 Tax=Vigna unguiculata TaxID=3917 RepID=A0A4D6MTY9_VIGUN|nr:hypothetical protein DEO72_LG8g2614 [Vigna unguiculata]
MCHTTISPPPSSLLSHLNSSLMTSRSTKTSSKMTTAARNARIGRRSTREEVSLCKREFLYWRR